MTDGEERRGDTAASAGQTQARYGELKDEKRDTLSVSCSDDECLRDVDADAVVRPLATVVEN